MTIKMNEWNFINTRIKSQVWDFFCCGVRTNKAIKRGLENEGMEHFPMHMKRVSDELFDSET